MPPTIQFVNKVKEPPLDRSKIPNRKFLFTLVREMLLLFLIIHVAFEQFQGKIVLHGIFFVVLVVVVVLGLHAGGLSEKKKKKIEHDFSARYV